MGYSLTIKKNIIVNASQVSLSSELNSILCDFSDSITLSKTIFNLYGWTTSEAFDEYRPDGTDEISQESLFEFITSLQDLPENEISHILDDSKHEIYFTFFESY